MAKPRRRSRFLTVLLCLCLLANLVPVQAMAAGADGSSEQSTASGADGTQIKKGSSIDGTDYYVTSVKNYSIAPDISERVIITNNDAGNSQTVANVMEVNTAGGRAKIVAGYGNRNPKEQGWTLKTTTDQAHVYEQETGLNVVGGVNASWFNINTGEPSGYLVMNGVVHHDNSSRAFVAAFDDGSVNVFKEGTTLAQAEASQSEKQGTSVKVLEAVDALVAMVWDGKVVVSESGNSGYYPRTCVGVKADGTVVLFQADGTMAPRSVGYTAAEEAQMMVALGCVAAIQLDEGGSSTYISQREGERDLTMRNTPAGGSERVVSGTILVVSTVAASGEFDHAAITPDGEYYTPGSEIALTASAMDYSGAPAASLPADVTFSVEDSSMGTVSGTTASGSAAAASFTSSGKTGDVQVKLLSGDETVGTATLHFQNPDKLAFTSGEVNLNYSVSSDLGFKATYQSETVHLKDGDIDWSISDTSAGSFAGNVFTVTDNVKYSGSPTVTAKRGDLSATVTVNIGMEPTMILDGGDADPWDYSTIGTTVESFDGMASDAVATFHYGGRGGVVKGSVVSDTDEEFADIVRFGHNAIKLEYDWTGLAGTDGACLGLGDNLAIDGTPTALGVWVYIPEGVPVPWLRAQIATSTNGGASWTNAYVNFSNGSAGSGEGLKAGWQYLEADLTQYAGALIRINSGMLFRAMVTTGGIGWYTTDGVKLDKSDLKGYILLDNLCVVYGANNQDVTAPTVNSIQLVNNDGTKTELENGAVLDSGNLRFFVTYDDSEETDPYATGVESAYFYFDGLYRGKYDSDNLGSTSGLMHFGNGLHSITFYLKDGYGNVTRETRYFTVQAEQTDLPGVSLTPQGAPTVGKAWELAVTSNDLASIISLSASISVSRSYPVTDVTFPVGVTGTWSYDSAKGVVTLQITAIDHAAFSADRLASVSVDVPTATTEGSSVNVQVTKGSYGCQQTESLDISDVNQYAAGFTTPMNTYPVEAVYRIAADTAVAGSRTTATVTTIADGKAAAGVSVYTDDTLFGTTDENGQIDISSLTTEQGSVRLRAADAAGNTSFQITLSSFDAVGDESGAPYNIIYDLSTNADGKTITWMSNPAASAEQAVAEFSTNADLSGATRVEGTSRLISYSASNQISRVNGVSLTGLSAGTTYYYRVGDGSVWSDIRSFTVSAAEKQTRFFLLADIQEEAALEGMNRIADKLAGQYHFGVQLGDAVDNVRYYNQWNDALQLFTLDGIRDTDVLHVIGNHEADDSGNGSIAVKSTFGIPADWYSVERGDVYIAVLNHTSDKDSLQRFADWLVEDAAKSTCTWKVLVTHVPAYYTNPTGGGEIYQQYLPAACDAAGIDFYFSGNDHSYARTAPLTDGQVNENGTVYYICGSTGGKSYSVVDNPNFHFDVATLNFESVYVDVTADRYQATVTAYNVAADGTRTVLDQFTRRTAPICQNDEHTYVHDRTTDELECSACGYTENAAQTQYNGWATDSESGRRVYFESGHRVIGSTKIGTVPIYFDANGLALDGSYTICGETCLFEDGYYVGSESANVKVAGFSGVTVEWILYNDGTFKLGGYGAVQQYAREGVAPWSAYRSDFRSIEIGPDVTAIGYLSKCFYVTSVTFAENSKLETLYAACFTGLKSMTELVLPESVKIIGYFGFSECSRLLKLYIPQGVTSINPTAFSQTPSVVLDVAEGSYAHDYAVKYGIAYTLREFVDSVLASGSCGSDVSWTLYQSGKFVVSGSGAMTNYPNQNAQPWAEYRTRIRSVEIGADITSIGAYAFYGASNLTGVTFEKGSKLQTVSRLAFCLDSSLTEIVLPEGVQSIGDRSFTYCSKLSRVYIPQGMSSMEPLTFKSSSSVVLDVVEGSYAHDYAVNHEIAFTLREAPGGVLASGSCGSDVSWTLYQSGRFVVSGSGAMTNYPDQHAQPWAEYRTRIRSVEIGADITSIGAYAFYGASNLTSVTFEKGSKLQTVSRLAFCLDTSLTEIVLPEGVQSIGDRTFGYCYKLTSVYVPLGTSSIDQIAFKGSGSVVLSVSEGSYAHDYAVSHGIAFTLREFVDSVLASGLGGSGTVWTLYQSGRFVVSGRGAMTNYPNQNAQPWAEYRPRIRSVEIGADITSIGAYAFYGASNLTSVTFEKGSKLQTVSRLAFCLDTSLTEIVLPEGVQSIGDRTFGYCYKLTSVYVPLGTSSIDQIAFKGSSNVALSVSEGSYAHDYAVSHGIAFTLREFVDDVLVSGSCGSNVSWTLYQSGRFVVSGSGAMENYANQHAQPWAEYRTRIRSVEIGADITSIGAYAFYGASNLTGVTFEKGSKLQTVSRLAFCLDTSLTEIVLPEGVQSIGDRSFGYCYKLTSVYVPLGTSSIDQIAFKGSGSVVLDVAEGSYAHEYAVSHGIAYKTR